jgi:predicted site-specific integrase-resolvase
VEGTERPKGTAKLESPDRDDDRLLPPAKVRRRFGIGKTTLQEWDTAGILKAAQRTAGGHRRYRESDVSALAAKLSEVAA